MKLPQRCTLSECSSTVCTKRWTLSAGRVEAAAAVLLGGGFALKDALLHGVVAVRRFLTVICIRFGEILPSPHEKLCATTTNSA